MLAAGDPAKVNFLMPANRPEGGLMVETRLPVEVGDSTEVHAEVPAQTA
jgi:hypothetical protein